MTNWLNARLNLLSEILVIARTIYQNKINAFLLVLLILAGSTYSLLMCNSSIPGTKINSVNNKVETLNIFNHRTVFVERPAMVRFRLQNVTSFLNARKSKRR